MTQHHDHSGHHHHEHKASSPGLHKDWRTWVVVVLMLVGMVVYVTSMDEEDQPGGAVEPAVPAAE